ncbi:unnamed protein product [Camellia sinensis]
MHTKASLRDYMSGSGVQQQQECIYAFLDHQIVNGFSFYFDIHIPAVLEWVLHNTTTDLGLAPYDKNSPCLMLSRVTPSLLEGRCVVKSIQCHCRYPFVGNPYLPNGCVDECSQYPNLPWCKSRKDIIIECLRWIRWIIVLLIAGWLSKVIKKINDKKGKEKFFKRNGGFLLQQEVSSSHGSAKTDVPLLVYEFIPNGTLFQHIHDPNEEFPLSWEMCFRISTEIAGALSDLHYAAFIPIYHQDIKSTNILLDDKYKAKVSDFGTSRLIAIDESHLTTLLQGTFGYLDPEYFQSSQFTEKSDVYSFGKVGSIVTHFMESPRKKMPKLEWEEETYNESVAVVFLVDSHFLIAAWHTSKRRHEAGGGSSGCS